MSNETSIVSLKEKIDDLNQQAWEVRVIDLPKAFELGKESVELARSIDYPKGLAEGLRSLGFSYVRFSRNDEAEPLLKESLSLFQSLNDLKGQAVVYEYLGIIERNWGNLGASLELLLKANEIILQTGPPEVEITCSYQLGVTYKHLGNHENALDYLYKTLSLAKKINYPLMEAYATNIIGSIYFDNGNYNQALDCYQQGLPIRQQSHDKWGEAGSLDNIGFTYLKLNDLDKAIEYCKQSLKITQATGDKKGEANTLLHLAEICQHAGDIGQASKFSNESLEIRKARGDKRGEAEVLLFLADLHKDQSDLDDHPIFEWLSDALKIAEEIKAQDLLSKAYYHLHEYYQQTGDFKESLLQLEAHFQIERELHKNSINQKVANLEISHKAEVVSQRNKELTELNEKIEKANEELKIERSLERVRTAAMAMKEPADMLEVCKIISDQLEVLDVKKIRNVQTAIFYEEKNAYMNYEYYAKHDRLLITEVDYNNHPVAEKFANQMLKGPNQVWTHGFKGEEVKDWLNYQRSTNVFIDTYLETADSLNYYWYSLGPVALGMSTYVPLNENEIDLFKRFRNVFELAYRRYLDIEKAEAQAREAQIELALERVRARTMAMHHSGELADTASVLFQQIRELGFETWSCGFCTWTKNDLVEVWMAADSGGLLPPMMIPYKEEPTHSKIYEASLRGETAYDNIWDGKELEKHYEFLKTIPSVKDAIEILERSGLSLPSRQCYYVGFFNQGYLLLITKEPNADLKDLSRRFAKVFEQTYTRFLDLQKAEAQARESQIEAAVEKVRSRSLAMHKSDELQEVVHTVFERLKELNVDFYTAIIILFTEGSKDIIWWLESKANQQYQRMLIPFTPITYFNELFEIRESGGDLLSKCYSFDEKNELFHHLFANTDFKFVPEKQKQFLLGAGFATMSVALAKNTGIHITSYSKRSFSDKDNQIIKRFANVFDQAYTRFLDLQKAEAQAREAKIEVALERARTQSMIMQHSKELDDTLRVFHEQVLLLGINSAFSFLWLPDEDKERHIFWAAWVETVSIDPLAKNDFTVFNSKAINYPLDRNEPATAQCLIDWKGKQPVVSYHVPSAGVESYFAAWQELIAGVEQLKPEYFSDGLYYVEAFMKYGCFGVMVETELSEDEKKILSRFAVEFERTYTRFLDLQKAEAQAREAQIEAALEKVRSRSLAMHKSEELQEVVTVVFDRLKELDIQMDAINLDIFKENIKDSYLWTSVPGQVYSKEFHIPFTDVAIFKDIYDGLIEGKELLSKVYSREEKNAFFEYVFTHSDFREVPENRKKLILDADGCTFSVAYAKSAAIMAYRYSQTPFSDGENEILKRFARVFEQSYTRFKDLQKAEAQAREAKIETALERVRSNTMAMHHSEELKEVISVTFEQIKSLDIIIDSCIITLFIEGSDDLNNWVASAEQKYLHNVRVPYFKHQLFDKIALAKKKPGSYFTLKLSQKENQIFYKHIIENSDFGKIINEDRKRLVMNAESNIMSFANFQHTGLRVGNFRNHTYTEEENNIILRFANVFEQTYTRFLDLQKAETQAREAKIEAALERVRARALAMQEPEELKDVAQVLRTEMGLLGVEELETCSIYINDESAEKAECWYALKDIRSEGKKLVNDHFALNLNDTWVGREMLHFYQSPEKQISIVMQGVNRKEWICYCEEHSAPLRGYYGEVIPDRTYHLYKFSHGAIGAAAAGEISEESWRMLNRAASVFSLAYSRFKDLTQARSDLIKLKEEKKRAEDALTELQVTQKQLIQAEKMASLGELTAGIAHEIQNPLNFVNNFSDVSNELLEEMKTELEKGNAEGAKEIAIDVKENLEKILHHGKRADAIVKGMLQHSRSSSGQKELTDVNVLAEEYLRLAYHGLRAKDKFFNAKFETDLDPTISKINIIPQEIGRVILNLINNSFYAVSEKKKLLGNGFDPTVTVSTKTVKPPPAGGGLGVIEIRVKDNGNGIPQKVLDKIFQPFFTTKPTGQGTGLGLSLSYDIITKGHDGEIKVETKEGEGSAFIISLPMK